MGKAYIRKGDGFMPAEKGEIWTHMLLERDEYERLVFDRTLTDFDDLKPNIKDLIKNAEDKKTLRLKKPAVSVEYTDLEDAQIKINYLEGLNKNLLRICKERANADRNLRPKKEHSGYLLLSSLERPTDKYNALTNTNLAYWETTIQTPYSIEFTEEQARKQIIQDLLKNPNGSKLVSLGIEKYVYGRYKDLVREELVEKNTLFGYRLKANYKNGYWEYIIQHTLPIKYSPDFYK